MLRGCLSEAHVQAPQYYAERNADQPCCKSKNNVCRYQEDKPEHKHRHSIGAVRKHSDWIGRYP